jgi:hypothetical protein
MKRALILAGFLAVPAMAGELEDAQLGCERDSKACERLDQIKAKLKAESDRRAHEEYVKSLEREAALRAHAAEESAREEAEEAARDAELKKVCGKDYHRVKPGMSWERVKRCSGVEDFELRYADAVAKVYESEGGIVRVERGKVTRVVFK